jgi:hypothetical protein
MAGAGLHAAERWSGWDRAPFDADGGYVVTEHRLLDG